MLTILIVDDRRDAIAVLQGILQQNGFATEFILDAQDIVSTCERREVDAVIMDLNMPEIDGCEATERLKSNETTAHIPVIICTASLLDSDRERASRSGCDDFIEKPVHVGNLLDILSRFFQVTKGEKVAHRTLLAS